MPSPFFSIVSITNTAALFNFLARHFSVVVMILVLGVFPNASSGQEHKQDTKILSNSLGMNFVYINPGSFMMGSGFSPLEIESKYGGKSVWYDDERPQVNVTLSKAFYIQTTEVTQRQWETIMGTKPSAFKNCGRDCPVEKISWYDAKEFIKKLNQKEKIDKYRLPTEAEWEYACRAGSTTAFCFGNDVEDLSAYAWYNSNARNWTHHVDQKKPNAWGLYDMHGNVWEWCEDFYGEYPIDPAVDPKGPSSGTHRVSRGGSWRSVSRFCRSAHRYGVDPGYRRPTIGFRLARDP